MALRTDLAIEAREMFIKKNPTSEIAPQKIFKKSGILITETDINNSEAAISINKPLGKYITLESENFKSNDPEFIKKASYILKEEILKILNHKIFSNVLVAGLGNRYISSDSLGPMVISKIMVTRHIKEYMPELIDDDIIPVSAISPGVLGITGIETNDIIKGVSEKLNPDLIIVVDALATSNPKRIHTVIQITDTGINPGSGVGNNRKEISQNTLNVPVIAIGVPTVCDLLSIAKSVSGSADIDGYGNDFFVTPKEIDKLSSSMAEVISCGINLCLHKNIDLEYMKLFNS